MFRIKEHRGAPTILTLFALLALAGFFAACSSKSTTQEPTPEAPEVTAFEPESDATGIEVTGAAVTATFSVDMDAATIDEDTFYVKDAEGDAVAGTISVGALPAAMTKSKAEEEGGKRLAVFTPSAALAGMTKYTATLTTGIKSAEGAALAEDKSWSFTTGAVAIMAASGLSTCATKSDGLLYCWGDGSKGEIGDKTAAGKNVPTKVDGSATDWAMISGGKGSNFFCAVKNGGTLWCWGDNVDGQLGLGTSGPGLMETSPKQVGTEADWVSVSCGYNHACATKSDGTLHCWGNNLTGQLGIDSTDNKSEPWMLTGTDWSSVSAGINFTCATKLVSGDLYCWGDNSLDQLGLGSAAPAQELLPTKVPDMTGVTLISAGGYHACALKSDGEIYCWGANGAGQIGDETTDPRDAPTKVVGGGGWGFLSSGFAQNCALKTDGTLHCWGFNESAQIGDGTKANRPAPTKVNPDADWEETGAGGYHSCARKTNGELYCWGENTKGQLGNGGVESLTPSAGRVTEF